MIVHRAWRGGRARSLAHGRAPSDAEPTDERAYRAMSAPLPALEIVLGGDPGCPAGADACDGASRMFAGSVVLDRLGGHFALVGEGWGMSYRDARVDVSQGLAAFGLRGYVVDGVWLQAGIGAASGIVSGEALHLEPMIASGIMPAAMLGTGFDVDVTDDIELGVSMHAGSAVEDGQMRVYHASLGVGLLWF